MNRKRFFNKTLKGVLGIRSNKKLLPKKNKNDIIKYKENSKGGEMPITNTVYPKTAMFKYPKLNNIDSGIFLNKAENFKYLLVELVKGTSFCVSYKKGKKDLEVNFNEREYDKRETDYCSLDANINAVELPLYEPFRKLIKTLGNGQVDFTVFLEYVTSDNQKSNYLQEKDLAKIIIYDIFINENWVDHYLLKKICEECGFFTMPVLYRGVYDEKIFKSFLYETSSHFNNTKKYGAIIKSSIEDFENKKRIAELLINENVAKEKKYLPVAQNKSKTISQKEISKEVKREIGLKFFESRRVVIDSKVKSLYPEVFKNKKVDNPGKVLSYAVKQTLLLYMNYSCLDISRLLLNATEKKCVSKEINTQLSEIFINRYKLFK